MTELIARFATFGVIAGIAFLAFVVWLNPKWLRDKPYTDQHGNQTPCVCPACTSEAALRETA